MSACGVAQLCAAHRPRRCGRSLLARPCPTLTHHSPMRLEDQADDEEGVRLLLRAVLDGDALSHVPGRTVLGAHPSLP
jgi:hypothetical protein